MQHHQSGRIGVVHAWKTGLGKPFKVYCKTTRSRVRFAKIDISGPTLRSGEVPILLNFLVFRVSVI